MRSLRFQVVSVLVALVGLSFLAGASGVASASDVKTKPSKARDVVAKLPKTLEGVRGKLELYGKISAVDKKGVVLSITKVDKQYPGSKLTMNQPYFGAAKEGDPEAWLLKKNVQLLWQKEGFSDDKAKKLYTENKSHYKTGQFLRILARWSEKDKAMVVMGATWFGSPGRRGAAKARS
jgi:hypothetical protein